MAEIEKKTKRYPTDLTDEEWARIEPFLPQVIANFIPKRRSVYFLTGRGIGLTPTCSSAVYGAP